MKYLVFNPTWTVPPGILRQDILPQVAKDADYLRQRNISVLGRDGRPVPIASVDWTSVSGKSFPYVLRQEPGPANALGRVKFIFPNQYSVFLHDTPSRALFERAERTFSSGCIRVENPLELAALLLRDNEGWDAKRIDAVVASGKTETVYLKRPLTVMLLYWTVDVLEDGAVVFRRDVYERDGPVLAALDAAFKFVPPKGFRASLPPAA